MNEPSEEKSLPASEKKLREARRKGQVPQSRDLIIGFTFIAAFLYLILVKDRLLLQLDELIGLVVNRDNEAFPVVLERALRHAGGMLLYLTAPLVAALVATAALTAMAGSFGPVFSFDIIKPKFEHVNPAKGLKRLVSLKSVSEFLKSLIKLVVLGAAFVLILGLQLQPLLETPVCGERCAGSAIAVLLLPLFLVVVLAYLVVGLADLLLQRFIFLREMRMTRSEMKRETKDTEGDPLIRSARRQHYRLIGRSGGLGLARATMLIAYHGNVVGLRYQRGETPVPLIVCKAAGEPGAALLLEARERGIPVVLDELAQSLHKRHAQGDPVKQDLFQSVADALVKAGVL